MRAAQKERLVAHWRVDVNGRANDADVHIAAGGPYAVQSFGSPIVVTRNVVRCGAGFRGQVSHNAGSGPRVVVDAEGLNGCSFPPASRSDRYASSAEAVGDGGWIDAELVSNLGEGGAIGLPSLHGSAVEVGHHGCPADREASGEFHDGRARAVVVDECIDIGIAKPALRSMCCGKWGSPAVASG